MATAAQAPDASSIVASLGISTGGESNVDTVSAEAEGSEDSGAGTVAESGEEGEREGADEAASDGAATEGAAVQPQGTDAKRPKLAELTTDEALKTPEGIKAAAEAIRRATVKHHKSYRLLVQREQEAKATTQRATAAEQNYQRLTGGLNSTLSLLQQGTPEQALHALGVLRGKAGVDAYEELTSTVIGIKKNATTEESPKVKKLEEEIAKIREEREHERTVADNNQWRHSIAAAAAATGEGGAPVHPGIAHFVRAGKFTLADIVKAVEIDKVNYSHTDGKFNGRSLSDRDALAGVERALADLIPAGAAPAPAPKGGAKPVGRLPGRGVPPSRAASGAGSRELTEEERMAELAKDPAVLGMLGL